MQNSDTTEMDSVTNEANYICTGNAGVKTCIFPGTIGNGYTSGKGAFIKVEWFCANGNSNCNLGYTFENNCNHPQQIDNRKPTSGKNEYNGWFSGRNRGDRFFICASNIDTEGYVYMGEGRLQ